MDSQHPTPQTHPTRQQAIPETPGQANRHVETVLRVERTIESVRTDRRSTWAQLATGSARR